jgi:hypothetical protein
MYGLLMVPILLLLPGKACLIRVSHLALVLAILQHWRQPFQCWAKCGALAHARGTEPVRESMQESIRVYRSFARRAFNSNANFGPHHS